MEKATKSQISYEFAGFTEFNNKSGEYVALIEKKKGDHKLDSVPVKGVIKNYLEVSESLIEDVIEDCLFKGTEKLYKRSELGRLIKQWSVMFYENEGKYRMTSEDFKKLKNRVDNLNKPEYGNMKMKDKIEHHVYSHLDNTGSLPEFVLLDSNSVKILDLENPPVQILSPTRGENGGVDYDRILTKVETSKGDRINLLEVISDQEFIKVVSK